MRISELAKKVWKYLPVLAVLVAIATGLFLGKDLYPTALDSQPKTAAQLPAEPNNPQPPIVLGAVGPCGLSNIYTSLPPKCKTPDGSFIPVPGTSSNSIVPEGK